MNAPNRTYLWTQCLVEELVRLGVDTFFVAPGSRSTPLTVAVARHPRTRVIVHVDERGTAFAALGHGRATGRPAGWITTSGTAVANGLPAVVEASVDGVPMLCLTADRPPELRGSGANQTIDQVGIFGAYPRALVDLPPPEEMSVEAMLPKIDEAIYHAVRMPRGPVHVNAAFRKPLEPIQADDRPDLSPRLRRWARGERAFNQRPLSTPQLSAPDLDPLAEALRCVQRGVIVAGRLDRVADVQSVRALASTLGWPLITDISSRLRLGSAPGAARIAYVGGILASRDTRSTDARGESAREGDQWTPEAVLHIGGRSVSKRLRRLIRDAAPNPYLLVRPDASRFDPDHRVTHHLETEPSAFCSAMMRRLAGAKLAASAEWTRQWVEADQAVAKALHDELDHDELDAAPSGPVEPLNEPMVARMVTERIPNDHALMLASSMPVRDANRFAAVTGPSVPVHANRGASGIDGTLATAAGVAVGQGQPVTCLIGDLATIHDMNSLALLQQVPVVVVLVNNSGGGIFHFLPISEQEDVFEPYFATPQTVDFSAGAAAFGVSHRTVTSAPELAEAYRNAAAEASASGQSAIIEVRTERQQNHAIHERLDAVCAEAVRSVISGGETEAE